jgi:hypothetical protein
MAYVWPVSLPQVPQKGFTETGGALIVRTPMDGGPAKMRRRGNLASKLSVSFIMTTAQVSTLETFVRDTTRGTARFEFTHPRTQQTVEVRMVPQGEGDLYNVTYLAPGFWTVTSSFEVLP